MEHISEILDAIKDKKSDNDLLYTRMEADFDLLALTPFKPEFAGYESYTSSSPRNVFDKVTDGLNRAQLSIQIKLAEDATEEQRRAASVGELYLFGALNAIDRRLRKRGEPPLREALAWFIGCRGWYALRALVFLPKGEKDTVFDVLPWDVMHTSWDMGPQGLLWAAYQYEATKAQIEAAYPGNTISGKTAIITDFWDGEANGVIIGTDKWGKELEEHNIGHIPVLVGSVGSMPTVGRKDNTSNSSETTNALRGDSVWASSRGLYKPQNTYISWIGDMAKRAVAASLVHESEDGLKSLAGDPYQSWQEIKVLNKDREKIYPLEIPKAPPEMGAVLQIIDGDLQRSTLPDPISFGGIKEPLSGVALSILNDNTRSVFSPGTGAEARIYTWLCEELLHQFAAKGMKPTEMTGYNPKEEFFSVKVKPKDINQAWYVDVKVEPRLPRDQEQEINQALRATTKRGPDDVPLISKGTAREEYMKLRDPDAEADKVLAEVGENLEPIRVANIAAALQRRGKDELAEQVLVLLSPNGATPAADQAPPVGPPVAPTGGVGPGGEVPPEIINAVLQVLIDSGQEQLAEALFVALTGQGNPVGV